MRLACIGDIAVTQSYLSQHEWVSPCDLRPNAEDKILFNMELPFGYQVNPAPRTSGPRLLSHPGMLNNIQRWSPGFAALATNHILDGGKEGLIQTIHSLNQLGFETFGVGMTQEEIAKPLIWRTKEGSLAVINWVFPETHPDWLSIPGSNCWPGLEEGKQIVRQIKDHVDWVLVFPHWSDECFPYPTPSDREVAKGMIEAGADLIIGHHPHVVRGMELIHGKPVLYSVGNFFFSKARDHQGNWVVQLAPRNREALVVDVLFQRGQVPQIEVLSYWQGSDQTNPDRWQRAVRRLKTTSKPLEKFLGDDYACWYKKRRIAFDRWEYRLNFSLWQKGWKGMVSYPFSLVRRKM